MLKVSVITISLNPGPSLLRTIESVVKQDYSNIEWVVVDGGSTDGSLEYYKMYSDKISVMISEKDNGIADAMNKGIINCKGDVLVFLNAGDQFYSHSIISKVIESWDYSVHNWITGGAEVRSEQGQYLYVRDIFDYNPMDLIKNGCRIMHQSTFVKKSLFDKMGLYNTNFKLSMDYELWIRLISNGENPQLLSFPIAIFYLGGTSSNIRNRLLEDRSARTLHNKKNHGVSEIKLYTIAVLKENFAFLKRWKLFYKIKEFLKI